MVLSRLLAGAWVAVAAVAHAQPSTPPTAGSATKLPYESAFADYRPYVEVELMPWQQANSEAAKLGGHMGQMNRASMPAAVPKREPSTTLRSAPAAAPTGHAGHPR